LSNVSVLTEFRAKIPSFDHEKTPQEFFYLGDESFRA